jgi:hypothetical protein
MDPINYSLPNPQTSLVPLLQGYQAGQAISDDQLKQQAAQVALQVQQQKLQQQQRQQQALQTLASNPNATASDYAHVITLIPEAHEALTKSWELLDNQQQQAHISDALQWGAAIKNGRPELVSAALNARADAIEAKSGSPTPESQALRANAGVVDAHPEFALGLLQAQLAASPKGKEAAATLASIGAENRADQLQPGLVAKGQADASKAQTEAGITAATVPEAVQEPGLKNAKIQEDIRASQAQTAVAQANSETQRGQLTLERDKLNAQQAEKKGTTAEAAQSALEAANDGLATIQRIRNHPGLESGILGKILSPGFTGYGVGTTLGKVASYIPGSDRKDFEGLVDTLKSQQFLSAVQQMKGSGALSDAEGKKLDSAVSSLNLDMSASAFRNALGVIETNLRRAQAKQVASGKLQTSGGGFVLKHPTFGNVSEGDINRLLQKNPGATREQVIEYLKQGAGQ